jgi:hypothetical protein
LVLAPSALLLVIGGLLCAAVYTPFVWPLRHELRQIG